MKLGRNLARLLWCTVQAHPVAETQREETRVVGAAGGRGGLAAPARPRAQRSRAQDHGLCGRLAGLANPGFGDFDGPTHPHTAYAVHTRGAQGVANGCSDPATLEHPHSDPGFDRAIDHAATCPELLATVASLLACAPEELVRAP